MMAKKERVPAIRFRGFTDPWEQRKLGECFAERSESMPDGELISVTMKEGIKKFSELGRHDNSNENKSKYKRVCIGDIAYNSMRMWQGASGYSPYEGIVSPAYTVLSPKSGIDSRSMAYYFKRPDIIHTFQVNSQGITSDNWNLKYPALSEIEVSIAPNVEEQQEISTFLTHLDHLITLHLCKYDKLVAIKKSMLGKMFPREGSRFPEIRFAGFTDPWEQRKLGEFSVKTGPFGSTLHADDYVENGTPIVTTEHFRTGDLPDTKTGIPQVSDGDVKRLNQYELRAHDIVFSRVGSVDLNAEVLENQVGWLFSGRVLRVRPDDTIDSSFLHYGLGTDCVRNSIIERAVGLTMPSINTGILEDTTFFSPQSKGEQKVIGTYFRQLDTLITLHQRKLEKLQAIKKAMLEEMFV